MAWYDDDGWLTRSLGPYLSAIFITAAVAILLPILLHFILYRAAKPARLPNFLVLGPSGAGKTSLVAKLESGAAAETHTSQVPVTIQAQLPGSATAKSSRYRSQHDHEAREPKPVLFTDTPGHGKLRHFALAALARSDPPTGVMFVVDAASLGASGGASNNNSNNSSSSLPDAAAYLHDVLLALQRGRGAAKGAAARDVPVLVAANKQDLFTALPAPLVRSALEAEIGRIRDTRARGLAAVETVGKSEGLGSGDGGMRELDDEEPLGGSADGKFDFGVLEEYNIHVQIIGGSAKSDDGAADGDGHGLAAWWDWVAAQL